MDFGNIMKHLSTCCLHICIYMPHS